MKNSQIVLIGAILLIAIGVFKAPEIIKAFHGGGVAPQPVPTVTLRTLVDDESAAKLSAFYRDFSAAIKLGGCQTTGDFRQAQQTAAKLLQTTSGLTGWDELNEPISARATAAIGLDDAPLDATKRAALSQALASISTEFAA